MPSGQSPPVERLVLTPSLNLTLALGIPTDTEGCPAVSLLRLNACLTLGMPTNSAASVDTDTYLSSALALALALALTEDCPAVGLRRSNA